MTTSDAPAWAPAARPDLRAFVPRERRLAPLALWLGCLGAALALLMWLGDGGLASPDLTDPTSWGAWARERGTAAATVSVLRIVALGLAWYLVGVTSVSVLAHGLRLARLARVADVLSLGPVRAVVQQALGVGLAVGVVSAVLPPTALGGPVADHGAPTVLAVPLDDAVHGGRDTDDLARGDRGPTELVATPLDTAGAAAADGDAATDDAAGRTPRHESAPVDTRARPPRASTSSPEGPSAGRIEPPVTAVRVAAGDHLWGIAETHLVAVLGRQPSEHEVLAHWEHVVATNRDRLVVPSNPDVLHVGQRIVLPDVELAATGGGG